MIDRTNHWHILSNRRMALASENPTTAVPGDRLDQIKRRLDQKGCDRMYGDVVYIGWDRAGE